MTERKPGRALRREPREGEIGDLDAPLGRGRVLGVGKLTGTFRDLEESDEDA